MHKGDFQTTNGDDPFGAWSPAMEDYCEQDVRVTAALFDRTKEVLSWGIDQVASAAMLPRACDEERREVGERRKGQGVCAVCVGCP